MDDQVSSEGAITGRVTTSTGAPVADAAVMITGASPRHRDIAALTNAQGGYRFGGLAPGLYTLVVNAAGYAPHTGTARVKAGQIAHLDFALKK